MYSGAQGLAEQTARVELLMLLQSLLENMQVKISAGAAHFFLVLPFVSAVES